MVISSVWYVDTFVLLITALFLLYKYLYRNFNYWEKRKIPFIEPTPIFGNFYDVASFKKPIGQCLADLYNATDEPYFGIYVFNKPHLVVKDTELIKSVLVKDFNYFYDRTISSCKHEPLIDNMLFAYKNPEWKIMRKYLTPIFTSGKLKEMFPLMDNIGKEMNKYIMNHITEGVLESKEICAKYGTDVIAKCAFAINAHSFDRPNPEFRRMGKLMFDFTIKNAFNQTCFFFFPKMVSLFKLRIVPKETCDFLTGVFWNAITTREQKGTKGNDLIDCLMDLRKKDDFVDTMNFKGAKVVAQAAQFFLAGFETTSSTIAFTLYELCIHPHIQAKLRKEILESIKANNGFTYESIMEMKYLNLCVCETLRKYPTLPFLDRMLNEDYVLPGTNVTIEKGTPVYIPMFGLHYDPKLFPHPEKYIPERFSENAVNTMNEFSYIPFGKGPRNCIGERFGLLATKLGLAHILAQFELIKTNETPVPLEFEAKSFILASKVGLPIKFKKIVSHAG